jgi:hypothetical protein
MSCHGFLHSPFSLLTYKQSSQMFAYTTKRGTSKVKNFRSQLEKAALQIKAVYLDDVANYLASPEAVAAVSSSSSSSSWPAAAMPTSSHSSSSKGTAMRYQPASQKQPQMTATSAVPGARIPSSQSPSAGSVPPPKPPTIGQQTSSSHSSSTTATAMRYQPASQKQPQVTATSAVPGARIPSSQSQSAGPMPPPKPRALAQQTSSIPPYGSQSAATSTQPQSSGHGETQKTSSSSAVPAAGSDPHGQRIPRKEQTYIKRPVDPAATSYSTRYQPTPTPRMGGVLAASSNARFLTPTIHPRDDDWRDKKPTQTAKPPDSVLHSAALRFGPLVSQTTAPAPQAAAATSSQLGTAATVPIRTQTIQKTGPSQAGSMPPKPQGK